MFFFSRIVVLYFFILINIKDITNSNNIKCVHSSKPLDQPLIPNKLNRTKRFVLFPEFPLWLNDWRYIQNPKNFIYWISNFYPNKINTNHIHLYINHIINNINKVIHNKISSINEGLSPEQSNFHFNFFNYEICPTNDRLATINGVQSMESLLIYPPNVVKENRYRAHGGVTLNYADNSKISFIKFNIHHIFLLPQDFEYEPVIYTCNRDESICTMDLYAVMLHETLHGFGIEHTVSNSANRNVIAVMGLYASRIMCHDDIRAIRKVYGLHVTRNNLKYDDTCRRDFPLNNLQKIFYNIHRWIIFYCFYIGSCFSFILFILTIIYLLLKKYYFNRNDNDDDTLSLQSNDSQRQYKTKSKTQMNAFLWHDDYYNN